VDLSQFFPCSAVLLGLDSLFAGIIIGPLLTHRRSLVYCALIFGLSDGLACLLGSVIPHPTPGLPGLVIYLVCAVLFVQGARQSRTWLYALPVVLSVDNLAAGGSIPDAPAVALISAGMAAVGLVTGARARKAVMAAMGGRASLNPIA
jgi:hypothetical protein